MVVEEYNHSKNSPAYRKLNTKYKALKAANAELMQLLANVFSDLNANRRVVEEEYVPRQKPKPKLRHASPKPTHRPVVIESESESESEQEEEHPPKTTTQREEKITCIVNELVNNVVQSEIQLENNDSSVVEVDIKVEYQPDQLEEVFEVEEEQEQKEQETVVEEEEEQKEEPVVEVEEEQEVVEETVVEVVEEEEQETVVEVVEEEQEEETIEEQEVEEEEEAGVYEIEVDGVRYYTTNEQDGIVYALIDDDDVGDEVGKFVKGKLVL